MVLLIINILILVYSLQFFLFGFKGFNYYRFTAPALLPLKTYKDLSKPDKFQKELMKVGGVYGFINLKDNKQYIGSSLNQYERLTDPLREVSSNIKLQRSIAKSGLSNFIFVIYYFHKLIFFLHQ